MKKFNIKVYGIVFIILVICIGGKLINNKENDYVKLDKILMHDKYTYPDLADSKHLKIITFDSNTSKVISKEEYCVQNNESLDINIDKDKSFIVSLPTFSETLYRWDIVNDISRENLKLENQSVVDIPSSWGEKNYGDSKARQNFYFSNSDADGGKIDFFLSSPDSRDNDNFKVTLKIKH